MATPAERKSPGWLAPTILGLGGVFLICVAGATVAGISLIWLRFATAEPTPEPPAVTYAPPTAAPGAALPTPSYPPPHAAGSASYGPATLPSLGPSPNDADEGEGHLEVAVVVEEVRGRAGVREGGACRLLLDMAPDPEFPDSTLRCSGSFECGARTLWEVRQDQAFACDVASDTGWLSAHDEAADGSRPSLTATLTGARARVTLYRNGARFLFVSAQSVD